MLFHYMLIVELQLLIDSYIDALVDTKLLICNCTQSYTSHCKLAIGRCLPSFMLGVKSAGVQ